VIGLLIGRGRVLRLVVHEEVVERNVFAGRD
jgi:hypothetical protein